MKGLDTVGISSEALDRVAAVWEADSSDLATLVKAGGLDPSVDFRHRDLRGWPLGGEDIRGFDFTGSDLRSTGVETAVSDATTIMDGTILDPRARERKPARRRAASIPASFPESKAVAPEGRYTKVRVPSLTDAELIDRTFVISDPLGLENVRAAAPPYDQWLTYEGRYEVGTMVRCSFAHRHKRGYVFRDEEEQRYLIGHECGAKHLGLGNWQSFTAGRERLEERASYLRLIRDLADALRTERNWIAGLPRHPAVQAFDELRTDLRTHYRGLLEAVRPVIARSDGLLTVRLEARDYAAEERRRERELQVREWYAGLSESERAEFNRKGGHFPKVDRTPITKRESRALGTLMGKTLFSASSRLDVAMRHVLPLVDAFLTMQRTPRTRQELLLVTRNARELVNRILHVREAILEAITFFDQENLDRFAQWADALQPEGQRFVALPGRIVVDRVKGEHRRFISRHAGLQPMNEEPFDRLRNAMTSVLRQAESSRR